MGEAAVVGDAEGEGALGGFAAEARQGLPDGQADVLEEVLPPRRIEFIAAGGAAESGAVLAQDALVAGFQALRGGAEHGVG
jgi:hypothetical protein